MKKLLNKEIAMYGLSRRVFLLLFRNGLTAGKNRLPRRAQIKREIKSGLIYMRLGFGEKTVKELADWLAR
jgi:hypothetical protein